MKECSMLGIPSINIGTGTECTLYPQFQDIILKAKDSGAIGKWQFGTDIMDAYRFMMLQLEGGGQSDNIIQDFSEKFISCADALQYVIDKADFCSEIHLLVKINHGGLL